MSQQFSILGTSTVNQRGKRLHCLAVMQWEGHSSVKLGMQLNISPR